MKHCVHPEINIYYYEYAKDCSYWTFKNVFAPYWRFYWNATPGGEIFYKGRSIVLNPDSIVLISPNTCFSTKAHTSFEQFHVHFIADCPFDHVYQNIYTFPITEDMKDKMIKMKKHMPDKQKNMHFKMMLFSLIYDGLLKIPKDAFITNLHQYDSRIVKILELLDKNTSWVFTNNELAEKIDMSCNGFIRLFSSETGTSPLQYSRRKRIEKACLLLHFSKQSIDDIALRTGFQDRYYFSRVFKQVTNNSPAQFRKAGNQ